MTAAGRCAAGVVLLPLLAALTGCGEDPRKERDARLLAECKTAKCVTVVDDVPMMPLGVQTIVHEWPGGSDRWGIPYRDNRSVFCYLYSRFDDGIQVQALVWPEDVILLNGTPAKVLHCDEEWDPITETSHSRAVLLLNPSAYAGLAAAKGPLRIPLDGGLAVLEGQIVHVAPRDWTKPPVLDRVSVDVWPDTGSDLRYKQTYHDSTYPNLRVGDTFTLGTHIAEVTRIVNSPAPLRGWVEVVLR